MSKRLINEIPKPPPSVEHIGGLSPIANWLPVILTIVVIGSSLGYLAFLMFQNCDWVGKYLVCV